MLNYYHRHLSNLSTVLEPLRELLRKRAKWKWQDCQKQSFRNPKMMLCSSKRLVHYDPSTPLVLSCDPSPYGIGAVISQTMPDGSGRPITYASRTLNAAQRNYSQTEKDRIVVFFAIKKFHHYLYGHRFTIFIDH